MTNRICMLVHQDFYHDGRVKRYTDGLLELGAEVDIVCVRSSSAQQPASYHENLDVYPIPMKRGYRGAVDYLIEYSWGFLLYLVILTRLYLKRRHQVIHIHNMPDFFVFTAIVPQMLGAEVLLDIHDPMPEFYASKFERAMDSWMVRIMSWQERVSAKMADAMIAANDAFKHNLASRGISKSKITVVSNFPDPNVFIRKTDQQSQPRPFTLIYPGTLAPRYGLDIAVRALPFIQQAIPDVRMVLLGHQVEYVDELKILADDLQVRSSIDFLDAVPIEQVPLEMMQADLGIYPALYDIYMDLVTPVKLLEFAKMGLPIVTTRLNGVEAFFSNKAVRYVSSGNVEEFANAVIDLYNFPDKRASLAQQADLEFTNKHSWSMELEKYIELVRSRGLSV